MYTLVIENSTQSPALALLKGNDLLVCEQVGSSIEDSSKLVSVLNEMLEKNNLTVKSLSKIIVGEGPGSYTGVRIASVIGHTLSYVLKIPLKKVSSLKGLVSEHQGRFLSIFDARSAGVYAIEGKREGLSVNFLKDPRKYSVEELKELLSQIRHVVSPNNKTILEDKGMLFGEEDLSWEQSRICLRRLAIESDCNHCKNVV